MVSRKGASGISESVDLSPEVYAAGGDFQLLCCSISKGKPWVSAAELIYEFTGEPGSVVRNTITFDLAKDERIEINLLDGSFEGFKGGRSTMVGRKGLDLLMKWKGMSEEDAVQFIAGKYSPAHADAMRADFVRMWAQRPENDPNRTPEPA